MTSALRILVALVLVGIPIASVAQMPGATDRELALLSALALLTHGERTGDLVSWHGGREFSGSTFLIRRGTTASRIEVRRTSPGERTETEQFDVEHFTGRIWRVNTLWSIELIEGPRELIEGQCEKIKGHYMLRYEFLEIAGRVCRFSDRLTVIK